MLGSPSAQCDALMMVGMTHTDQSWDNGVLALSRIAGVADTSVALEGLPPGYRESTSPEEAVEELAGMRSLVGSASRYLVRESPDPESSFRLRRLSLQRSELAAIVPILESFGLSLVESVPFQVASGPEPGSVVHVDDMAVRVRGSGSDRLDVGHPASFSARLVDAFSAAEAGLFDIDALNRLVVVGALAWRQVAVLRAYVRYWSQVVPNVDLDATADSLVAYPEVTAALAAYFEERFDPARTADTSSPGAVESARGACVEKLAAVARLDDDRSLRGVLGLIDATWRTNFYAAEWQTPPGDRAASPAALVLKMDGRAVPQSAPPRPEVETFVHSTTVEGIHLRAGRVARGGIRWSERPDDFRTEVLDLAFAQVKKNAPIVPTGAKGGFVVRSADAGAGRSANRSRPSPDEIAAAYKIFISALLEITDNYEDDLVVSPSMLSATDGPDPYFVVAADKGTASFSDLANSLAEQRGFWLGDAFASGGSRGYDHKAMGITARGAWVAVRRHFKELGIDVSADPFRVVGVGDMSGDVFGNGMIQSRAIELVGAFDHRHIFLDPLPDRDNSFEERVRLSRLARSSWDDYDRSVISKGGGVWPRDSKSLPVSPEAASTLGIAAGDTSPLEVVSAILAAPVDLLWFGGIGTFVAAPGESDADVADHANDVVRITSDKVRARVIGEGANLGVTQRARLRYSRRGGRVNADFIDNAAGVATSDREVNLKILLALAISEGRLAGSDRDDYLSRAEDEVAAAVLAQVDHSVVALNRAARWSERELDAYESLADALEAEGSIDRGVEVLPDRSEFEVRRKAGAGLIRPELATLLAYAKSDVVKSMESSGASGDPAFAEAVHAYFPSELRRDFSDLIPRHRLYHQLAATDVAGEMVDRMGIVWAHDLAGELGKRLADVATAFWVARRVCDAGRLWARLDESAASFEAAEEADLRDRLSAAVGSLARGYLLEGVVGSPGERGDFDIATVARLEKDLPGSVASSAGPAGYAGEVAALTGEVAALTGEVAALTGEVRRVSRLVELLRAVSPLSGFGVNLADAVRAWDSLGAPGSPVDRITATLKSALEASPPPSKLLVWQSRVVMDDLAEWRRDAALQAVRSAEAVPSDGATSDSDSNGAAALGVLSSPATSSGDRVAAASLALRRLRRGVS